MQNEENTISQAQGSDFPFSPPAQSVQYQTENVQSTQIPQNSPPAPPPPKPKLSKFKLGQIIKIFIGVLVFLVIIMVLFFAASKLLNKESSGVNLTFWGLWEDGKTMQTVLSDFERQHQGVKVNYSREDLKQYKDRLLTRTEKGNGPDIFLYHNTWRTVLSDILLPLPSSVVSAQEFNNYFDVAKTDLVKNGAIYGIPQNMDTLVMYVNTDILASGGVNIPSNWNDFIDASRSLTVKDEEGKIVTAGTAMGTFGNVTHAPDIVSLLFLQNGVDTKNLDATSDRAIGALNFYTAFSIDENNVWDDSMEPSILAFSKGKLGMYFGYSWDYFTIKAANPSINMQIVPVPQLGNDPVNLASYWVMGASVKSKNQKQVLDLIKYLSSKDVLTKLYLEEAKTRPFGQPYPRIDMASNLKDTIIYPSVLQGQTANSSLFVDAAGENGINQELNTYLENAINTINDGTSVESAFETFKQGVAQVLDKYGAR
ncbi:MAG: hypothetical protein A3B38_03340 [Candidatus Levybacteria bacterium RIFCSPLOWO2_01_FULL_36_13]|nr:MAG: hypothetical protein A2684_04285 [Candidatus Levybacteria bacterium RIFCSPHIGHO2_01_FULL_36_15b]OGH34715.1 MAG: hypothetical protein A3B38_03340 [Candidatus Levybacteria bacterium RIFCSPLOWO2_01_FULL_36_13]